MARETEAVSERSGWVMGLITFAGIIMIWSGFFQIFEGLAAILRHNFYVVSPNYVYALDVTTWGWIHLIIGIIVTLAGFFVFAGQLWARLIGILFATLSAIANFFFIPYYPLWSLLIIILDIGVIWALSVYRHPE